ncbi:MAG: DUF1553 domain-containing protein [Verrucomicrobiaceae bacterium]|nr:DUF1553 domain-containing protein [Verrucomicrobiaceae bacterium]
MRLHLAWIGMLAVAPLATAEVDFTFFESQVRPVLIKRCYECHSAESGKSKGGLLLDSRVGWEVGGDAGQAIVPGKPEQSLLIHSIRYEDEDLQMPPKSKLPVEEIQVLERWVAMGAPDPRIAAGKTTKAAGWDIQSARKQWAYRPHQAVPVPYVKRKDWPKVEADAFILATLEAKGLKPALDASAKTLLRRVSYDLTGLPPSDYAGRTYEQVVDDLLSSKAFGEKWGRYWLDLARYADSNGGDRNYTFYQAWRYRNYVIDSLNRDKSYYDFVREQIAGDLLPSTSPQERNERLTATTFLALGPKMLTERDKEKLHLDTVDEQLDTIGKALLGTSLGCARCHDHKFDPITQKDYYAMAGFFRSTEVVMGTRNGCVNVASWVEQPMVGAAPELKSKVERLELAMRLKVERDFMETITGKKGLSKLPLAGVIYDDSSAELVGDWVASSLSSNRFGEGYMHDDRAGKGAKRAVFRGALPESGIYEVRVSLPGKANCDRKVPVTVEAKDKVHEVVVDQTRKPVVGGLFVPLGRYFFEKGGRANVIIRTDGTKGYVIVDAVQFVSERDLEREATALAMADGKGTGDPLLMMDSASLTKELNKQIDDLKDESLVMAPRDFRDAGDVNLRVRGEVGQLGPLVPRNFPAVLHEGSAPKIKAGSSGRDQLAEWLVGPGNALLDRVVVNRVWAQLFGRGIVATVDNFGAQGQKPDHPELLDYLALKFRKSGGSLKTLIRELVLSRTYRLASEGTGPRVSADPENRLFARHVLRRLTAEEIRDSMLALSGELNLAQPGATALRFGEDLDDAMKLDDFIHRSVYLPVARNNQLPEMEIFDAANPEMTAGERPLTTVPTQALYLLNGANLKSRAKILGERAYLQEDGVKWLYQTILGRDEDRKGRVFVEEPGVDREKSMKDLAHVLLASTEFLFLE